MKCKGADMPERENDPPLRTWWRWPNTGALVYWVDEDVFLSYLDPHPLGLHGAQTAIVRRQTEDVLVLEGDYRKELEGKSLSEIARYYDGCPQKACCSNRSWAEGLPN